MSYNFFSEMFSGARSPAPFLRLSIKTLLKLITAFNNWLTSQVQLMATYLTTPFILHFGQYDLVWDFVDFTMSIANCCLVYFILFATALIKAYQTNFSFKLFFTNFLNDYDLLPYYLTVRNYVDYYFNLSYRACLLFFAKINEFLRKK